MKMNGINRLGILLIVGLFVYLFWPFIAWILFFLCIWGIYTYFKLKKRKSHSSYHDESGNKKAQSSPDIIDVEYTERRISDEQ